MIEEEKFSNKISKEEVNILFNYTSQNYNVYKIPNWQRNYAWTDQNVLDLFNDIYREYTQHPKRSFFLGSMIVIPRKENEDRYFEVIDGQQRLTTLTIFISIINAILGDKKNTNVIGKKEELNEEIDIEMVKVKDVDQEFFEIFVSKDLNRFKNLDNIETKDLRIGQQKMLNAYHLLHSSLNSHFNIEISKEKEKLINFRKFIFYNVYILKISVEGDHEMALNIFNSINNRGSLLCESDLIKAQFKTLEEQTKWNDLEENLSMIKDKKEDSFQQLFNYILMIETDYQELSLNKNTIEYFLEKYPNRNISFFSEKKSKESISNLIIELGYALKFLKFFNIFSVLEDPQNFDTNSNPNEKIAELQTEQAKLLISIQYFIHERPFSSKIFSKKLMDKTMPILLYYFWKNPYKTTDSIENSINLLSKRIGFLKNFESYLIEKELINDSKDDSFKDSIEIIKSLKKNNSYTFNTKINDKMIQNFYKYKFDFNTKSEKALESFKVKFFLFKIELNLNQTLNNITQCMKVSHVKHINGEPPSQAQWKFKLGNFMLLESIVYNDIKEMTFKEKKVYFSRNPSAFITTNQIFKSESEFFETQNFYERNTIIFIQLSRAMDLSVDIVSLKKEFNGRRIPNHLKKIFAEEEEINKKIQNIEKDKIIVDSKEEILFESDSDSNNDSQSTNSTPESKKRKPDSNDSPSKKVKSLETSMTENIEPLSDTLLENNLKDLENHFSTIQDKIPFDQIEKVLDFIQFIDAYGSNYLDQVQKRLKKLFHWNDNVFESRFKIFKDLINFKKEINEGLPKLKKSIDEYTIEMIQKSNESKMPIEKLKQMDHKDLNEYILKFKNIKKPYLKKPCINNIFIEILEAHKNYLMLVFKEKSFIKVNETDEKTFIDNELSKTIKRIQLELPKSDAYTVSNLKKTYEKK